MWIGFPQNIFRLQCSNIKIYDCIIMQYQIFLMLWIICFQAEHTFILALDGDVDFKPDAVRLLTDRLKKNMKTGAACGRIHPIGTGRKSSNYKINLSKINVSQCLLRHSIPKLLLISGAVIWYQVFEYAIGHWFQKATEHVYGCVLCSPGLHSSYN